MNGIKSIMLAGALLASCAITSAQAAGNKVVIGDIDDMSGVYSDVIGQGGIEAAKMAIEDFGGSVLGNKIELLTSDHQNKPDLGAQKFREWADRDGLTMVLGGSNTGVSIAMSTVAKEKKVPFFAIGAAGASLTGKDCTPYSVHYVYDTTSLGNGTATTMVKQGGKSWFFLTADYAFGTQLQEAAENVVKKNGGKVLGAVRVPLATVHGVSIPPAYGGVPRVINVDIDPQALFAKGLSPADVSAAVLDEISGLRADGARVAIDDFGTGYSNIARLRTMPLDRVKLDPSLIAEIETSEKARVIVQAVIHLIKGVGCEVIAEAVETVAQADILRAMGCDTVQGFVFAQAMFEHEFLDWTAGTRDPSHSRSVA